MMVSTDKDNEQEMTILVTGAAGFIGRALCDYLLQHTSHKIVGIDNLNDYYAVQLKHDRLSGLENHPRFIFEKTDIADFVTLSTLAKKHAFSMVIHLAAQAGVRYSIENPHAYAQSNLLGFTNILELVRQNNCIHLVYASSSSVYGSSNQVPFVETANTDNPVSFYAATKKANEAMAASYAHLYGLSITGLRFFTVYGEWGRPDMAPWLFTKAILNKQPIKVFNHGKLQRDFTYIEDIVEGIWRLSNHPDRINTHDHQVYNIGNNQPVELMDFIQYIEEACGIEAIKEFVPMQKGDVFMTCANTDKLNQLTGFRPNTPLQQGIQRFVLWYQNNHQQH